MTHKAKYAYTPSTKNKFLSSQERTKLPLLRNFPVNYLALFAFAVPGLINPGFRFRGAGLEVGYLVTMASNSSYQKLVQGRQLVKENEGSEQRVQQK